MAFGLPGTLFDPFAYVLQLPAGDLWLSPGRHASTDDMEEPTTVCIASPDAVHDARIGGQGDARVPCIMAPTFTPAAVADINGQYLTVKADQCVGSGRCGWNLSRIMATG